MPKEPLAVATLAAASPEVAVSTSVTSSVVAVGGLVPSRWSARLGLAAVVVMLLTCFGVLIAASHAGENPAPSAVMPTDATLATPQALPAAK